MMTNAKMKSLKNAKQLNWIWTRIILTLNQFFQFLLINTNDWFCPVISYTWAELIILQQIGLNYSWPLLNISWIFLILFAFFSLLFNNQFKDICHLRQSLHLHRYLNFPCSQEFFWIPDCVILPLLTSWLDFKVQRSLQPWSFTFQLSLDVYLEQASSHVN